jgi:hypothetical protein
MLVLKAASAGNILRLFNKALRRQCLYPAATLFYPGSHTPQPESLNPNFLQVLEAAYTGTFEAAPLRFGEAISGRVEKASCQYYTLEVTQRHITRGFIIGAHSVTGSKFKLLMFEAAEEGGQWELQLQEDSIKARILLSAGIPLLSILCFHHL